MKAKIFVIVLSIAMLSAAAVSAQDNLSNHPGYFPLENLGIFTEAEIEVDINLSGSMLALISGATSKNDPEFSEAMSDLLGIRVLVGSPQNSDLETVMGAVDAAASRLESAGWDRIVRVRNGEERVHLFVKEAGENIDGLTVLAVDGLDEVSLVNIVGTMDPAVIGELIDDLDDVHVNLNLDH